MESSCYPHHQGLLSVSWWSYSGGFMLVESYWWIHELVVLFWWYHTGGFTTFEAFWPETHRHIPLTQIWLRDMNSSTRLSAIHLLVKSSWWNHTDGITVFAARRPEPHPHFPLTQIWLRDMNFSTVVSHPCCCSKNYAHSQ